MRQRVVAKARIAGNDQSWSANAALPFGYNNLVSDMRALTVMRATGCPVVFGRHPPVQLPGGQGNVSGGQREFVPVLARRRWRAGIAGLFMETHPDPDRALSDGPNVGRWAGWNLIDRAANPGRAGQTALVSWKPN